MSVTCSSSLLPPLSLPLHLPSGDSLPHRVAYSGFPSTYLPQLYCIYLLVQAMEIESCKIIGLPFCIWFEASQYLVEDIEANRILQLSKSHLGWFIDSS